jgi:hypothetical protein
MPEVNKKFFLVATLVILRIQINQTYLQMSAWSTTVQNFTVIAEMVQ